MELLSNGWIGEGEADIKQLKETTGTRWVVFFLTSLQFGVFHTERDAQEFFEDQLHQDYRKPLSPVQYLDGKPLRRFGGLPT